MKNFLTLLSCLYLLWGMVQASTIYVPEDYATIGEAITAASDGDSILVGPGIYDPAPIVNYSPNDITMLGNGYLGPDRTTIIGGSEAEGKFDLRNVTGWEIGGFELTAGKKGINTYYANDSYFHDLYVHNVTWFYADGVMVNSDNTLIERCIFEGCPYAGIEIFYPPHHGNVFRNNTIINCENGILVRGESADIIIENNLVAFNDDGIEFVGSWIGSEFLDYNDVYSNTDGNWIGCPPGPHSISADPEFVGGSGGEQYMLQPWSPCIDAGNPASPPDPDGTIADIGCFYFNQSFIPGSLTVDLEPVNPPIVVPVEGGSFEFTAEIACDSTGYALYDAWTELLLPNGLTMGPFILREGLFIEANGSRFHELEMFVSMWAMPGTYELWGKVGEYPEDVWASDMFTFEKLEADGFKPGSEPPYAVISGWGELERVELPVDGLPVTCDLTLSSSPNPFNPETAIEFSLPQSGMVSLKVYDLSGRAVATLIDRQLETGLHTEVFGASHLSSGLYIAVLQSGRHRVAERLMLIK